MASVEVDIIILAEVAESSAPERDPVRLSKQWPGELMCVRIK